jgi:hypothetical protein
MKNRLSYMVVGIMKSAEGQQGPIIGTGFILEADVIVTAYHVLQDSLFLNRDEIISPLALVWVLFPKLNVKRRAYINLDRSSLDDDIATLIVQDMPVKVSPAQIGFSLQMMGRPFVSMGYRVPAGSAFGILLGDELRDDGLFPRLLLSSDQINHGMSGAPVVDLASGLVVGMIISIWQPKEGQTRRDEKTSFAVSSQRIHDLNPNLSMKAIRNIPIDPLLPILTLIEAGVLAPKIWEQCRKLIASFKDPNDPDSALDHGDDYDCDQADDLSDTDGYNDDLLLS